MRFVFSKIRFKIKQRHKNTILTFSYSTLQLIRFREHLGLILSLVLFTCMVNKVKQLTFILAFIPKAIQVNHTPVQSRCLFSGCLETVFLLLCAIYLIPARWHPNRSNFTTQNMFCYNTDTETIVP